LRLVLSWVVGWMKTDARGAMLRAPVAAEACLVNEPDRHGLNFEL
jgi:hypothetical protein